MLDNDKIKKFYSYTWQGNRIANCYCKLCDFIEWRALRPGVIYGVLRSKVLSHIRKCHPEIWGQCRKDKGSSSIERR